MLISLRRVSNPHKNSEQIKFLFPRGVIPLFLVRDIGYVVMCSIIKKKPSMNIDDRCVYTLRDIYNLIGFSFNLIKRLIKRNFR